MKHMTTNGFDECYTGTGPAADVGGAGQSREPSAVVAAAEVVGQVRQTKHILASEQRPRDGLPRFRPSSDGRTISDEDFIFDAMLSVGGDFGADSVRCEYARWVCDALNEADKSLPGSPEVAAAPQGQPTYTELLAQRDELAEQLACVRQALPPPLRDCAVPSVGVATLEAERAELLAQRDELARLLKGYMERDEMTRCTNSWLYATSSAALSRIKGA